MKKTWPVTMGASLTILLLSSRYFQNIIFYFWQNQLSWKVRSRLLRLYVFIENPASINYET